MTLKIILVGIIFGSALQYAKLNKYNVISGLATLEKHGCCKSSRCSNRSRCDINEH